MKRCPQCNRVETDEALKFCRVDGTTLISDSGSVSGEAGTAKFVSGAVSSEIETSVLSHRTDAEINRPTAPTSTTREFTKSRALGINDDLIQGWRDLRSLATTFHAFGVRNNAC